MYATLNENIHSAETILLQIITEGPNEKLTKKFANLCASINNAKTFNDEEVGRIADFQMWAEEKICDNNLIEIIDPDDEIIYG